MPDEAAAALGSVGVPALLTGYRGQFARLVAIAAARRGKGHLAGEHLDAGARQVAGPGKGEGQRRAHAGDIDELPGILHCATLRSRKPFRGQSVPPSHNWHSSGDQAGGKAQRSRTMSTRRSATVVSPEPVWPIGSWRTMSTEIPSFCSSSATTCVRVWARYLLASTEPVALARPSMRMACAPASLKRAAALAMIL